MILSLDLNDVRVAVTAFSFALFCGLAAWTWLPRRRAALDEAARLPLEGDVNDGQGGARP